MDASPSGRTESSESSIAPSVVELLIKRLNEGDSQAAEQLFIQFEPYLRMAVRRRIQPKFRAKFDSADIVQSVWANLLIDLRQSHRQFDNEAHLRNFLNRVVLNKFNDRYRQHRREVEAQKALGESELAALPSFNEARPSQVAQHDELWDQILQACPARHHQVLHLRREGLRHKEIAERTGLHASSVRRIFYEIAKQLKQQNLIGLDDLTTSD